MGRRHMLEHLLHQHRPRGHGPDWGDMPFPFPGPGGRRHMGPWGGGGPRIKRDVRAAVLLLLDEQPRHGYELIQEISTRSSGEWTPSPGSIYPTLQALEDEGLVTIEPVRGRKTASLTPEGSAYVAENRDALGSPWQTDGDASGGPTFPGRRVRSELGGLMEAFQQVMRTRDPAQVDAALDVIATARKDLYRLLADDER